MFAGENLVAFSVFMATDSVVVSAGAKAGVGVGQVECQGRLQPHASQNSCGLWTVLISSLLMLLQEQIMTDLNSTLCMMAREHYV